MDFLGLTEEFATQKQTQWASFLKKSQIVDGPANLIEAIQGIAKFIAPIISQAGGLYSRWIPGRGWDQ
jgi:hypothetical protein